MANKSPEKTADYDQSTKSSKRHHRKKGAQDKLLNVENLNSIPFSVVEAYKNIRVQLTTVLDKIGGKAVAISSPNASEGKSTTSINIAITLSQLNKKVIIVDADIRRGTVHQKLKMENDIGCIELLSGTAELESTIKQHNSYLDVITCGNNINDSSEIFDTARFDEVLKELKSKYDYVILDTPPINLVSDALVISKKCDGLLYVIRSSFTTYEAFRKSLNTTEKLNINLLGVVLNAVDANAGRYYKYSKYGHYDRYDSYGYYDRRGYYGYYDYSRMHK